MKKANNLSWHDQLAKLIKERALQIGDFTLASGQKSNYFLDSAALQLDGEIACLAAEEILAMIPDKIQVIAACEEDGALLGAILAIANTTRRSLFGLIVKKKPGQKRVRGKVPEGAEVMFVTSILTSGTMALDAIEALKEEKQVEVVGLTTVVDHRSHAGAIGQLGIRGYPVEQIFAIRDLYPEATIPS